MKFPTSICRRKPVPCIRNWTPPLRATLDHCSFCPGSDVTQSEKDFAKSCRGEHCVAFNGGTTQTGRDTSAKKVSCQFSYSKYGLRSANWRVSRLPFMWRVTVAGLFVSFRIKRTKEPNEWSQFAHEM